MITSRLKGATFVSVLVHYLHFLECHVGWKSALQPETLNANNGHTFTSER